jgi:hypothetical protein
MPANPPLLPLKTLSVSVPAGLHPATAAMALDFAEAMARKLHEVQERRGAASMDWRRPGWEAECRRLLAEAVAKGDPVDVANYCAFLYYHGVATAARDPG